MSRIIFSFFFLFTAAAYGADFFVDSQNGDDSRAGTSIRNAWKSLKRVNEAKFVPGDRIQFRADGVWNGTLKTASGSADKPITYTSFGRGKKPSFRNCVPLGDAGCWTNEGDGIWSTKTESLHEVKNAPSIGGSWGYHQKKEIKGRHENFNIEGRRGLRAICTDVGGALHDRQFILGRIQIEAGKQYVLRFRARSTTPTRWSAAHIQFGNASAPYNGLCKPREFTAELGKDWSEHAVHFVNGKTSHDARLTVSFGSTLPKNAVVEFVPLAFFEVETKSLGLDAGVVNLVFNHKEAGVFKTDRQLLREPGEYAFDAAKGQVFLFSKRGPWLTWPRLEAVLRSEAAIDLGEASHVVLDGLDIRCTGSHGIHGSDNTDVIIRNCDISWTGGGPTTSDRGFETRGGNGIELYGGAETVVIENCRIGEVFGTGIALVGTENHRKKNVVIVKNIVWNCNGSLGVFPETRIERLGVKGNVFHGTGRGWARSLNDRPDRCHVLLEKISDDSKLFALEENRFSDAAGPLVLFGCDAETATQRIAYCNKNIFSQPQGGGLASFGDKKFTVDQFDEYRKTTRLDADSSIKDEEFTAPVF